MAAPGYVLKHRRTTLERAEKFISDQYFTDCNLRGRLFPERCPVSSLAVFHADGRIRYEDAVKATYTDTSPGQTFGPTWSTHWFRVEVDVPGSWAGHEVVLVWDSEAEALVWQDGEPLQGLTAENKRTHFTLTEKASRHGSHHVVHIEMACNGLFGAGQGSQIAPPDHNRQFALSKVEVAVIDRKVHQLLMDFDVIIGMAKHLPPDSNRGYQALYTANQMVNTCNHDDRASYDKAHQMAQAFFSVRNGGSQHTVCAVGHCHIDSAWLWPYAETIRKCARSWSSTLRLMDRYKTLTFACSQAQQFAWVKEHYPPLYSKIQQYVKEGRFIPVGGAWVEMDGNLPSGESFCRQFLYGQRFFQREFGSVCKEFWLPDTFGYSGQIPQILRQSGITLFLTQKLSWNLVNKFPHHTFHWAGIDGSRVLTHFPPGDSYEMKGLPEELLYSVKNFADKGRSNRSLYLFGFGDGGQGPTEDMVERLQRMRDVDGLPKVAMTTPADFFSQVQETEADALCVWNGELFFELHNGTYTSQAKTKQSNRRCEFLLHDVEALSCVAMVTKPGFVYPGDSLEEVWKLLLLNQFHDVLPGSSIGLVYEDATRHYEEIMTKGGKMMKEALAHVFNSQDRGNVAGIVEAAVVVNTLSWDRTEVVKLPTHLEPQTKRRKTEPATQTDKDGHTLALVSAPSYGFSEAAPPTTVPRPVTITRKDGGLIRLENEHLQVEIDGQGRVTSLSPHGTNRNVIVPGQFGNQFVVFDDVPLYWDAWDVMDYHLETRWAVETVNEKAVVVEEGPLRASVHVSLNISAKSTIHQYIGLNTGDKYLTCRTEVDWHEDHKFLKVEFPVNANVTEATYDIQMGHLKRPSTFNTSWDWARFEVCGHKWADVSEYNFGLAVLSNSNYGWSCINNTLRLSLLRSPKAPDEKADMGLHRFTYALMPHTGSFQAAGVIQAAYALNCPLVVHPVTRDKSSPVTFSLVSVDEDAVVVETVKRSEDRKDGIVLRLYEAYGGAVTARVKVNVPLKQASRCNVLEELMEDAPVTVNGDEISLDFRAFEIISLLLVV